MASSPKTSRKSYTKVLPYDGTQKLEETNPGYFIVRPNGGPLVPLIPIDELPEGLEFVGLKRSMEVEDTIGMANLGIRSNRVGTWRLVGVGEEIEGGDDREVVESDHAVLRSPASESMITLKANPVTAGIPPACPVVVKSRPTATQCQASPPPTPPSTKPARQTPVTVTTPLPTTTKTSTPPHTIQAPATPAAPVPASVSTQPKPAHSGSGIIGEFQPQICRHWCAYGLCKWGENCRYLHIMPTSRSGLQEVGLADWPQWWRTLIGIPSEIMDHGGGGTRLTEREKQRERERIGKTSVYPTGPRERFSRGLNIDYGRSAGDVRLAREWEERLMRERARARGKGAVGGAGGKGKGKQRRGAVVRPPFLQTVVRDGKIVGVGVGDGSMLKTAAGKTDIDVKGKATEKPTGKEQDQDISKTLEKLIAKKESVPVSAKAKASRKESESEMTTEKKLDQDVVRATKAWEDDDGDENKENEVPIGYLKGKKENGVLVDI